MSLLWNAYYFEFPLSLICILCLGRSVWLLNKETILHEALKLRAYRPSGGRGLSLMGLRSKRKRWAWIGFAVAIPLLTIKWQLLPFSSPNYLNVAILLIGNIGFMITVYALSRSFQINRPGLSSSLGLSFGVGLLW